MKYPPNTICVFKLLAAWPAAELLPSYGVALAPHVLISVAKIKPVEVPQQRHRNVSNTRYFPQSPSGCSLPGPTSTPFDDRRGNPVRLKAEACTTVGFLLLFSATHSHSVTSSTLVSVAGGIDESLFKAQRCALIIEHQRYDLQFGFYILTHRYDIG
ncbi:hypothetical protein B0H14DRAFT_3168377 [Mycena olivaceomarginata]|nr:hypothetical protein B0H14DRAFT_3168377 [Mycena olivaceomarginata]